MIIRPAVDTDLPRLTDIYNHYVENTAVTFDLEPWKPEDRRAWLAQFSTRGTHRILVAEIGGIVMGYACSHKFRERAAYNTSVETSIYLAHDATGRGLGRTLYRALIDVLKEEPIHRIYAGITLPNARSVRLHEDFGFEFVGTFTHAGLKHDKYWDVAFYELHV